MHCLPILRQLRVAVISGALAIALAACAAPSPPPPLATAQPPAVAVAAEPSPVMIRVAGEPITRADVERRMRYLFDEVPDLATDPVKYRRFEELAAESEIRDLLFAQGGAEAGIVVTEAELDAAMDKIRAALGTDAFRQMLAGQGKNADDYRAFVRRQLLAEKFVVDLFKAATVSDEAVVKYYEGHKERYTVPAGAQLLLLVASDDEAGRQARELIAGGASFAEAAARYAVPERRRFSEQTPWVPYADLPAELQGVVQEGAVGDLLGPLRIKEGVYLLRIVAKRDAGPMPADEGLAQARQTLLENRRQKVLDDWVESRLGAVEYLR